MRLLGLAILALVATTPLFAAGQQEGKGEEAAQQLVILSLSDVVSLDPHGSNDSPSSNLRTKIYHNLVYFNEDMELQAGLATEWEVDPPGGCPFHTRCPHVMDRCLTDPPPPQKSVRPRM